MVERILGNTDTMLREKQVMGETRKSMKNQERTAAAGLVCPAKESGG